MLFLPSIRAGFTSAFRSENQAWTLSYFRDIWGLHPVFLLQREVSVLIWLLACGPLQQSCMHVFLWENLYLEGPSGWVMWASTHRLARAVVSSLSWEKPCQSSLFGVRAPPFMWPQVVTFCPPVEPGGHHSWERGQAACLCPAGGGTAVAVAEGKGLLAVSHGEASALGHSIKAAWGVEASLTQLHHSTAALFCMQLPRG